MGTLIEFYSVPADRAPDPLERDAIRAIGTFVGSISLNSKVSAEGLALLAQAGSPGQDRILSDTLYCAVLNQIEAASFVSRLRAAANATNQDEVADSLYLAVEDAADEARFRGGALCLIVS